MRVAHLLPRQRGNVAVDNYTFVNALLWMCRTGAPWRDLPECYGKWITVYRRFNRWSRNGVIECLFTALQEEHHRGGDPGARHGLHEREGPAARGRGTEKRAPSPSVSPGECPYGFVNPFGVVCWWRFRARFALCP
ncbi:transposase, partial [Bifidobacterium pullorum subsp. saeculare]|uniref:transposase n=1 Tax=Bifidobacterium pullorum TaxID=78448 RepID=UPI00195EAD6D|nr:transposase [Bifidobacterium pullorum subsp. saeculare]